MYKIKMLCFDYGTPTPYEDEPVYNDNRYNTYEEAYDMAKQMATEEAEYLNEDCTKFTSFGIVEDEEKDIVRVLCYMLADETDTTGETNQVTNYWVEEVF